MTQPVIPYTVKDIQIGKRSRRNVRLMRWLLKGWIRWFGTGWVRRLVNTQTFVAGKLRPQAAGLPVTYDVTGGVPGPIINRTDDRSGCAILYIHGGGFLMPAMPRAHLGFLARLARDLNATAYAPDYRLAPLHPYPAALDDCERVYRAMLDDGWAPERIALAGDSAGGNLVLGLLQRIRRHDLPMPSCAVPISPVCEMARVHEPPSRRANAKADPMLPIQRFVDMLQRYAQGADGSDPELSPMSADFAGFPPLYFLVGETEVLLDDSLICVRRAKEAGVDARVDVWPVLPHAFPLMAATFSEAKQARIDVADFMRSHGVGAA